MITEQELEERITEHIDREEAKRAILKFEIDNLQKAVERVENVSRLGKSKGRTPGN
jgi:hypothetical protein